MLAWPFWIIVGIMLFCAACDVCEGLVAEIRRFKNPPKEAE